MRLNESTKHALVHKILEDIPHEDFETKLSDLANHIAISLLPQSVRDLVKRDPSAKQFLRIVECYVGNDCHVVIGARGDQEKIIKAMRADAEFMRLSEEKAAQLARVKEARTRIKAAVYSCTTDKQFADRFPEFAQYLPKVCGPTSNLPVDANLITDLMRLGWPKGKAPEVTQPKANGKAKRAAAEAVAQ